MSSCLADIEYGCYLKERLISVVIMPFSWAVFVRTFNVRRPAKPTVVTGTYFYELIW